MSDSSDYVLPRVWTWDQPSGGQFENINRPIAGPTYDQDLPVGKHPFQLYSLATPNGQKASILFEELLEKGRSMAPGTAQGIGATGAVWLTASVQIGFVMGAITSTVLNLADRFTPQKLLATSALGAAACTAAIAFFATGGRPKYVVA